MPFKRTRKLIRFALEQFTHQDFIDWYQNGFTSPSPRVVKQEVMRRNGGNGTWIETGTFLGDTTLFLSKFATKVITLEPEKKLFQDARKRFQYNQKITCIQGTSEDKLAEVLSNLSRNDLNNISFWLDGHYSGGITYRSHLDTPIVFELSCIQTILNRCTSIFILIDDVRCFNSTSEEYSEYPGLNYLVAWSERNNLRWTIEHDVFIISNTYLEE